MKDLSQELNLVDISFKRVKTKYDSYSSFPVEVMQEDFEKVNDSSIWPQSILVAPFCGRLNHLNMPEGKNIPLEDSSTSPSV